ncbi:MAG: methyltransferase domain-containing protein, partial [Pseudomonadota bacterium]|nr:methyltransferase domain-containing protein [Pseudomonadota bacterium]
GAHGSVVAIDPSSGMLAQAQQRAVALAVQGVGERLPFADASFDVVCMGYALRHVADLNAAFSEFRRVLRPRGFALLLEITAPQSRFEHALLKLYMKRIVPAISRISRNGRAASRLMSYYWETVENCVPPLTIIDALRRAGFEQVERKVEIGVFSTYRAVSVGSR